MRRRAVVVGAGTMGAGLALLLARHGHTVTLVERSAATLERGLARAAGGLDFLAREGMLAPAALAEARARLHGSTELAGALAAADLVLEAVTEDPDVKREVYAAIGRAAPEAALVASTTSGLDVFGLAGDFPTPARLVIAHFWNPPYLVPLVEVVPGPGTSAAILEETEALLRAWERVPVRLAGFVPGFVGVRLNSALYREAVDLVARGVVDARGIDTVMRESIALRFPVLDLMEIADFGGLDTFARVWTATFPEIASAPAPPAFVGRAVADGALGVKSGRGFHDWRGRALDALLQARDRQLARWLRERGAYRLERGLDDAAVPPPSRPAAREPAMARRKIAGPEFGARTGAFSNGYVVDLGTAEVIHTAGHLAVDADGRVAGGADTARQAEWIYGVLARILEAAGATLDDVVKTTAYLTDIRDYPRVNEVRNRVFAGREPASTMVEVTKLVHPDAKIEIELVAIRAK
jgi:3-hydroxybutyryl-CoA dehydrogenase